MELVKQNEELKRKDNSKEKEIKRLKDELSKMKNKIHRQGKKIDALTRSKKGPASTTRQDEEK